MQTSKKTTAKNATSAIQYDLGVHQLDETTNKGYLQAIVVFRPDQPEITEQLNHMLDLVTLIDPSELFNVYARVFAGDLQGSDLDGMFFNSEDKDCYLYLIHVLAKMARTHHKFLKEKSVEYKVKYDELLADTYD